MATIGVGDVLDLRDAAAYLRRLLRLDQGAVVRLRSAGGLVGIFAQPPLGVVTMRTMDVVDATRLDRTVAAAELVVAMERAHERASTLVELPPAQDSAWIGSLPTGGGWQWLTTVPGDEVRRVVNDGAERFRAATGGLVDAARTPARLDAEAQRLWAQPVLTVEYVDGAVGLPLRVFSAAHALGFLAEDDPVDARISAGWLWLDATYGSVYLRRPTGLSAFGLTPR